MHRVTSAGALSYPWSRTVTSTHATAKPQNIRNHKTYETTKHTKPQNRAARAAHLIVELLT